MPSQSNTIARGPLWEGNTADTWIKLQHTSSAKLTELQSQTTDPEKNAWLQLALLTKQKNTSTQAFASQLINWRTDHPSHPANTLIPSDTTLNRLATQPTPEHIAVLIPQNGPHGLSGQAVKEGFLNTYYQHSSMTKKQDVKFYDTTQTTDMLTLYQEALTNGADFIIGPLTKDNVQQLIHLGTFSKTTVALNYTDTSFGSLPANFYEFGLLPEDEANQIASRAHDAGLNQAIVIIPDTAWGERISKAFSKHWQSLGGSIQETWTFNSQTDFTQGIANLLHVDPNADKKLMHTNNKKDILEQQRRHDFDVIFLFTQPQDARTIVPLLKYYYANDIPIYATASVYSGKPNPTKDVDLNGVIICDIPWSQLAGSDTASGRLYAVGQDAYRISQSLQRLIELPNFPLYGTTGALTLSSQQQIHRRLPCMAIHNGLL